MKRRMITVTLSLLLVLALGIGFTALAGGSLSKDEVNAIVNTTTDQTKVTSPVIDVANTAAKSIVGVNNYQQSRSDFYGYGYGYFNVPETTSERLAATGSGVVVTKYGHILTNNHVVKGASRVTVTYEDKELQADVVASDAALDLAVLHAPGLDLPAVPLGDSDSLQVGEYAIVIGNPLGQEFERTTTVGFVSALNREVEDNVSDRYGRYATVKNQMIQVDAAINQGNSGGGMFNTLGQLQGIPARKYDNSGAQTSIFGMTSSQTASIDNIGMCIPINVAKPLLQSVLENFDESTVKAQQAKDSSSPRPVLGVTVQTLRPEEQRKMDGTLPNGAYVKKVEDKSPAQAAGIKKGDIIVEVNGTVINNSSQLVQVLQEYKEGDTVKLKVFRVNDTDDVATLNKIGDSQYIDLEATLAVLANVKM